MKNGFDYLASRREKLAQTLKKAKLEAYLFEDPKDIFYLTGIDLSLGRLLVSGESWQLFVDGRYFEAAKKRQSITVYTLDDFEDYIKKVDVEIVGVDGSKTSIDRYHKLKGNCDQILVKPNPTHELRKIKDDHEIMLIQTSADILIEVFIEAQEFLKEGITEKELSNFIEAKGLALGAEQVSFRPIVAFNEAASLPHHKSSNRRLTKDSLVLIDAGFYFEGYASDMTRVFFFGEAPKKLLELYVATFEIFRDVKKLIKPGIFVSELDNFVQEEIAKRGLPKMLHSLGHGVGLDLHEAPRISKKTKNIKLQENMVITIEPGIYLEGSGGVRLEDMLLITRDGYKNFYEKYEVLLP